MRPMRLVALALVAALVGVLAVGCGGGQAGGAAALPVLNGLTPVADATEKAGSARFDMNFELEMGGFDTPLGFSAAGAYDTPAKKAELTMDLGSFAKLIGGFAGALGGDAPEGLDDPSKWKLELRLDGTVAYMRIPFLASELPSGKEWVGIDLEQAARMQGRDLGELQSLAQGSDPRAMLDYLRSVAARSRTSGRRTCAECRPLTTSPSSTGRSCSSRPGKRRDQPGSSTSSRVSAGRWETSRSTSGSTPTACSGA